MSFKGRMNYSSQKKKKKLKRWSLVLLAVLGIKPREGLEHVKCMCL